MGADVVEIRAVSERVLRDDINIAPIKLRIARLALRRNKALAEDGVGRAKTSGISAAVENGVACHLRIDGFAILAVERRREHVVTKPVSEQVVALFVVSPMRHVGLQWNERKDREQNCQRSATAPQQHRHQEHHGESEQQKVRQHWHGELAGFKRSEQRREKCADAAKTAIVSHENEERQEEGYRHDRASYRAE